MVRKNAFQGDRGDMSIRYGIGLALEPSFTARAYRARQLICGQYASWAAEMHMVYVPVAEYIDCSDSVGMFLRTQLSEVAARIKKDSAQSPFSIRGVNSDSSTGHHIYLDLACDSTSLNDLREAVAGLLLDALGLPPQTRVTAGFAPSFPEGNYRPCLPLMQHAKLSTPVFRDAVEFARAVVTDLQIPDTTRVWRLLLLRFESQAAGEKWSGGRWATDLRWELLASHLL